MSNLRISMEVGGNKLDMIYEVSQLSGLSMKR